jgi:hypothetical protein
MLFEGSIPEKSGTSSRATLLGSLRCAKRVQSWVENQARRGHDREAEMQNGKPRSASRNARDVRQLTAAVGPEHHRAIQ